MGGKSNGASGAIDAVAGATPYGAAANAISGLASGGPSSAETGDQGGATFGPISFGGFKSDGSAALPPWVMPVVGGVVLIAVAYLAFGKKR